jgi:hypothetical protein
MTIQLTSQQQQILDSQVDDVPPRVVDPRTNTAYVLVAEADYDAVRDILEDERLRQAIHNVALRNAVGRMDDAP